MNSSCIILYADDICLFASSPFCLQKLLNVCDDFSKSNLIFNHLKTVYIDFTYERFNLYIHDYHFSGCTLKHEKNVKYLGYLFDVKLYDMISKEMRKLYIRYNSLLRTFGSCSVQTKKEIFRSFCTVLYSNFC